MSRVYERNYTLRSLLTAAAAVTGALSVAACSSGPNPNRNNVCAAVLQGDIDSLGRVNALLSSADSQYEGDAALYDGETGALINLSTYNPNTSQMPGDVVLATGASLEACDTVHGQYFVDRKPSQIKIPLATPPTASGQE